MGVFYVWLLSYIFFPGLFYKNHIQSVCNVIRKKTQTWLNIHDKFISAACKIIFRDKEYNNILRRNKCIKTI